MDWLGQKLSRIISICVVSGCLSCGVYGDETIDAPSTTAKTINVSDDNSLTFSSTGSLNVAGENAVNFTGTGAGETFTITNGSSATQLISATNVTENSGYCNASAIDLTGINGEAGKPFTISLSPNYIDGQGTEKKCSAYSFSATANKEGAGGTFATVIGVPRVEGSVKVDYVTVDTNGDKAKLNFSATATGGSQYSGAAVFGTGWANGTSQINVTNWTVGDIGAGSKLRSSAEGGEKDGKKGQSYSTIFGAGRANGAVDFKAWTIGNIGKNSKLTSQSEYSTIFGAGHAYFSSRSGKLNFANWNIGNIGANASLESKSSLSDGASSIVGPAYAKSTAATAESLDFSGLTHGGAEAGVKMKSEATGTGDTYSTVFGAGYAEGSIGVKNWTIGTIGGTAGSDAATTLSSKGKYSSVFGAGYAKLDKEGATLDFSGWKIGSLAPSSGKNSIGNNVTITSEGEYATIFGAGQAYLSDGAAINFSNWSIGAIGDNAEFTSTSSSSSSSFSSSSSSIFGARCGSGDGTVCNFSGWTIGDIGANAVFTSTSSSSSSSFSSSSSSIFGAGDGSGDGCNFSGWTIGGIGDNANFTSTSSSSSSSYSSIFGAGSGSGDVSNWTVEFQGNAMVASLGYTTNSANCHISTFGGYVNGGSDVSDGMRFYFNGKQKAAGQTGDPVVTIGALKLANAWEVTGTTDKTATATIAGGQDSQDDARAFGIGPNFQINVGRERELADTKQDNGTLETLDSITSGGKSSTAVTMNILGEIRAAEGNTQGVQTGSVMRIDGGSTVNCFRPVSDLSKIEIINGTMNLMGDNAADKEKLTAALQHLQANISYSTYNATSKETELYQNNGDKDIALGGEAQARDGRTGNVALKVADGGYPIDGKLTIGSGQTLAFGVDLTKNEDGNLSMFKKTNGVLYVPNTGQHLVLNGGKLAIDDSGGQNKLNTVPANTNFYVVQTGYNEKYDKKIKSRYKSFVKTKCRISEAPYVFKTDEGSEINLYRITDKGGDTIIVTDNDEYTYWEGLHAYWMNDEGLDAAGIVIGTGGEPASQLPTDYTKDFASEELAAIDVDILSDVRDQVINMELCGDGQDPFIMVIGGHGHQDEILGYGYDYDKYGIVIGHDFVKELSNGGNLKFGGAIGYCHANIDFFGNATSRSKHAGKDMYNVGIFGMYKNDNSKHMHTRFHVFGGFAYVENEMSRVDSNNAHFNTKFDSNDINVSAEWMKGMVRLCGLEVGPWAGVTYNRIHQKSYHENGGRNAASLDAVDFDMLDTILGLHAEKIFLHKEDDKKYLHLILRAGWKCQPIRSHSHCLARLDDAGIAPFVPVFGYADKHSGILYGGLKNKISDNISISGGIGSTISHDHWNISGHIALNYYY